MNFDYTLMNFDYNLINIDYHPICIFSVLAEKGSRTVTKVKTGTRRFVTTMFCTSALGELMPPYIIVPGKPRNDTYFGRIPLDAQINKQALPGSTYWITDSGWMNTDAFLQFLRCFNEWEKESSNAKRPILLLCDGAAMHSSMDAVKYCKENGVHLYLLPPNSTHVAQPLDASWMAPIKSAWRKAVEKYTRENIGEHCTIKMFPNRMNDCLTMIEDKERKLQAGFRTTGIFPFDLSKPADPKHLGRYRLASDHTQVADLIRNITDGARAATEEEERRKTTERRKLIEKVEQIVPEDLRLTVGDKQLRPKKSCLVMEYEDGVRMQFPLQKDGRIVSKVH